jgi:hypothetical protein
VHVIVWLSSLGYNHHLIGQRVSQIQAVLARRCAAIGELQEHLLRASWKSGVASWGVLGQGGQWEPVSGFQKPTSEVETEARHLQLEESSGPAKPQRAQRRMSSDIVPPISTPPTPRPMNPSLLRGSSRIGAGKCFPHGQQYKSSPSTALYVRNTDSGEIFVDDPSVINEWAVASIALVRAQLYRAANGTYNIPFESNWHLPGSLDQSVMIDSTEQWDYQELHRLPVWARRVNNQEEVYSDDQVEDNEAKDEIKRSNIGCNFLVISSISSMTEEVSGLVDAMEDVMTIQRQRRLIHLQPLSWIRRNWYLGTVTVPPISFFLFRMLHKGYAKQAVGEMWTVASKFIRERVLEPCNAM